jgi:hypothetical protein
MCSASGSKETAHSNHRQYSGGGGPLCLNHISMLHMNLQLLWPWLQQHGTRTTEQHSPADLNISVNPPLRSPAQNHVLEFNCLPLSHFHSQIPKIYNFQIWFSPSLHHPFLCLASPSHPNSSASTQCLQHSP